ncbi:protein YnhH [Kluyvera intermedia]|uniref:protein YnhH n=1 Tax=Kluyvera intermedia TaxID=61648 RepID=UPI003B9EF5F4
MILKQRFHFLFCALHRIICGVSFLNGFSSLDCINKRLKHRLFHYAEPLAHFPLHAFFMSPILMAWHSNFRNTALALWPCGHGAKIQNPNPSQSQPKRLRLS